MKRSRAVPEICGAAGFLLCASLLIGAQTPTTAPAATAVPVEQEPRHRVVFRNDYVRVIDATLPAGYVTLNHTHSADNVSVTISNGREGDAALRGIGRAGFSRGGYSHTVTNSGNGVMRYIVVEPLKADHPGNTAASIPRHVLETENDRVRIYRVRLAPGESLASHVHSAGRVDVTVTGPDGPGAAAWIAAGDNRPLKAQPHGPALEIVEIEPK